MVSPLTWRLLLPLVLSTLLLVTFIWGDNQHVRARQLAEREQQLKTQIRVLTAERDAQRQQLVVQAATVNREQELTEYGRKNKQSAGALAAHHRTVVHQAVSAHACAGVPVPDPVAERLLGDYTAVRNAALYPSATRTAGTDPAVSPARRLTFGQLSEWNVLLMGDLAACNADKTVLRQLDMERGRYGKTDKNPKTTHQGKTPAGE